MSATMVPTSRPRLWLRQLRSSATASLVLAIAALALAVSLPDFVLDFGPVAYVDGGVSLQGLRVTGVARDRKDPIPLKVGDVIEISKIPFDDRFESSLLARTGPAGRTVNTPVIRDGKSLTVPFEFQPQPPIDGGLMLIDAAQSTANLLLVLIGSSLVLLRPTRLSWAFFLFTAGAAGSEYPVFWSFLPALAYVFVVWTWFAYLALASMMYTIFALRSSTAFRSATERRLERGVIVAIIPIFCLAALRTALLFTRPEVDDQLLWFSGIGLSVVMSFGILVFLWSSIQTKKTGNGLPVIGSLLFAAAGAAFLFNLVVGTLLSLSTEGAANPLLALIPVITAALYFPLSIAGAFVMLRHRALDVRLSISRASAFAAAGYAFVAVVVAANVLFARRLANVAFLVPLELMGAVWLGYCFSGLRLLARTESYASEQALSARMVGDISAEHECFIKALAAAELSRKSILVAEIRARMVFSAWLDGDEEVVESNLNALEHSLISIRSRGLHYFCDAARGGPHYRRPAASDLAEWVCRAHLMSSANAKDAATKLVFAGEAAQAAVESGQAFLEVLGLAALCELSASDRSTSEARLRELAVNLRSPVLDDSVQAFLGGQDTIGLLGPFIRKFRPLTAREIPPLEIAFTSVSVRVHGTAVRLRDAELALLFAIAYRRGPVSSDTLIDKLWGDRDGDAAKNALRVCLHRLRRGLGDAECIVRSGAGYALSTDSVVDLHRLPAIPRSSSVPLDSRQRVTFVSWFEQLRTTENAREIAGAWFSDYALELKRKLAGLASVLAWDSVRRQAPDEALSYLEVLLESDPADLHARELQISAYLALGERSSAQREYEAFKKAVEADPKQGDDYRIDARLKELSARILM